MRGRRTCGMYFLWPVEVTGRGEHPFCQHPGYVQQRSMLGLMRRAEAVGIGSAFPHPPHLYELLLRKEWQAALCLDPWFQLPATTKVPSQLSAQRRRVAVIVAPCVANTPFQYACTGSYVEGLSLPCIEVYET